MKGYTTREVAEVLDVPTTSILAWARRGLIEPGRGPRGAYVFSFQDIVLLRTARELLAAEVPARRVRTALEALRAQLPSGRPLSAVTISSVGDRVLVRDEDTLWEPDSGQLQIDFAVREVVEAAAPVARRAFAERSRNASLTADDWFDAGVDLEAVGTAEAAEAYERAIALEPKHADAHLNLGRLLHEEGRLDEAERHYQAAVDVDPHHARAWYNLGVVREDRGSRAGAIASYEDAIRLDPSLAAAYVNLSSLLEAEGRQAEALGHLAAYRRLLNTGADHP